MAREHRRKRDRKGHPWRENIEALVMAIVVALLFKVFFLEISKIPSGSMQPTLMGSPQTGIFDRIVVDKLSMHLRDPRRFEIVVFKHPLERSRVMVKRLVGLPGEDLRIEHGDLWTRPGPEQPWTVLRRPEAIMESAWRRVDPHEPARSSWEPLDGTRDWRFTGREVLARGPGTAGFRPGAPSITDLYTDGYHDSVRAEIGNRHPHSGTHDVGDLRLTGTVTAREGLERATLVLGEGERRYAFELPGPAAGADARPRVVVTSHPGAEPVVTAAGAGARLEAGDARRFAVENLDDELALALDGEELVRVPVEPAPIQESRVALEVAGAGASFEDLQVYRDVYYYDPKREARGPGHDPWQVTIPEGHYVMLGDNTLDSADSRDWVAKRFTWEEDGETLRREGNFRAGVSQPNPVQARVGGRPGWAFRDRWGELHWFAVEDVISQSIKEIPSPLVPRELIQGRAFAVFWPLVPSRKLWRLGWLH